MFARTVSLQLKPHSVTEFTATIENNNYRYPGDGSATGPAP